MVPHTKIEALYSGVYNYPAPSHEDDHYHHQHHSSDSHTSIIVGIVCAIVGSLIVASLGWFMLIRRRRKLKSKNLAEFASSIHASRVSSIAQDEEPPDLLEYARDEKSHESSIPSSEDHHHSVGSTETPFHPSIHSTISSDRPSMHYISSIHSDAPSLASQTSIPSLHSAPGPSHPTMTLLSQTQPAPRQSSETARGSFDCPPWNRDSRFQEFF